MTPGVSARRVGAIILRHVYLMRSSPVRVIEMAYWPTVQMIMWGFISQFFLTHSDWLVQAAGALVSAVLLWDVVFRGNLGLSLSFLEEMWSRNLGHLFVSPLRPYEHVIALTLMSLLRTLIGITPAALLAIVFYEVNIFDMGLPLLAFFSNLLVMGWVVGLGVSAMVLRFGLGAESLAWVFVFAFAPLSGIYYPISTLPDWLQPVAWALPAAHVFEGMRGVLFDGVFHMGHFAAAVGLNVVYFSGTVALFLWVFHLARQRGQLLNMGE
ncbi:MAG: ABC transporter [Rhodospirillaceae bacterium BRH_c57]|nr:MAG: ABC transporter [Rhodospirillaceae bacterium BRH_c57]